MLVLKSDISAHLPLPSSLQTDSRHPELCDQISQGQREAALLNLIRAHTLPRRKAKPHSI